MEIHQRNPLCKQTQRQKAHDHQIQMETALMQKKLKKNQKKTTVIVSTRNLAQQKSPHLYTK